MKKTLLLILLFVAVLVNAQRKTIAITKFETISNIPDKYVKAIQTKVVETFQHTNRFNIVDRTSFDKVKQEKELQKSEEFMDGKVVAQTSMEGADAIVAGVVNGVDFGIQRVKLQDGSYSEYYVCNMSLSLKVIDVATGQVLGSKVLTPKRSFMGSILSQSTGYGPKTKDKAFSITLARMQKPIDKFVAEYFPIVTSIIEITDAKKNYARKVLLNTGETNGTRKNQIFYVYELKELKVNGKKIIRKLEIGKLKITKVEGDEVSEAKVSKGGKAIFEKFNAGAKIECYSKK